MNDWMPTVGNHCFEKIVFRLQDCEAHAQQYAQYSWRLVLNKHAIGVFIMTAFICITYKNTKPVTMQSCQPCTILWMAANTATNMPEILFTHRVQCTGDSFNSTSICNFGHSKLHSKWHISFYYYINHTDATWGYP